MFIIVSSVISISIKTQICGPKVSQHCFGGFDCTDFDGCQYLSCSSLSSCSQPIINSSTNISHWDLSISLQLKQSEYNNKIHCLYIDNKLMKLNYVYLKKSTNNLYGCGEKHHYDYPSYSSRIYDCYYYICTPDQSSECFPSNNSFIVGIIVVCIIFGCIIMLYFCDNHKRKTEANLKSKKEGENNDELKPMKSQNETHNTTINNGEV